MTARPLPLRIDTQGTAVLADWVRDGADRIANSATDSIWQEIDAYRNRSDPSLRLEVETHCRQVFLAFLHGIDERRYPVRADFPWTARHAMRRVDVGITLPDFMKAFRIGQIALWNDILTGVQEHPATKDAALLLVDQVMRTIEVGSTTAAEAYLEAQQYALADSARLARDLVEDLLAGRPPSVRPRLQLLADVGLEDEATYLLLAARPLVSEDVEPHHQERLIAAFRTAGRGLVVARHDEVVAVLPVGPGADGRLLADVRSVVNGLAGRGAFAIVGVSSVRQGYAEVPAAYDEARMAGRGLGGRAGVLAVGEMSTLDFLIQSQDGSAGRLVRPDVRAFLEEDLAGDGVLVETLSSYLAHDLNATLTAMTLHVHVNTVYYRLQRIAERTNCDIRRVEELIDLLVAVRVVRSERRQ